MEKGTVTGADGQEHFLNPNDPNQLAQMHVLAPTNEAIRAQLNAFLQDQRLELDLAI